jgi:hypothetical protein
MLKINLKTIPHDQHRYPMVGDYWDEPDGTLQVRVSEMGDPRYEFLVAFHELIEKELCRQRGISEPEITRFDLRFEEEIEQGLRDPDDEPGDAPDAPYRREHAFATNMERMLAHEMGVDWGAYEAALDALYED